MNRLIVMASHAFGLQRQGRVRTRGSLTAAGVVAGILLLSGCAGGDAGSPARTAGSDVAAATTPGSAEPLAERTVAVDHDGARVSADPAQPSETVAADSMGRVSLELQAVEAVEGEATLPGEVAAPAVRLTLLVANDSGDELETTAAVVNVSYGAAGTPANTFQRPGGDPFPGLIEAGSTATGIYLFDVPKDERDDVRIEVDIAPELRLVVFEGDLSTL